jgi:hypothetical protein
MYSWLQNVGVSGRSDTGTVKLRETGHGTYSIKGYENTEIVTGKFLSTSQELRPNQLII